MKKPYGNLFYKLPKYLSIKRERVIKTFYSYLIQVMFLPVIGECEIQSTVPGV